MSQSRRRHDPARQAGRWIQLGLPFVERTAQRERRFKRVILLSTGSVVAALIFASPTARDFLNLGMIRVREAAATRLIGLPPERSAVEAEWALRRRRGIEATRRNLEHFYRSTTDEMRELFRVAGMDPEHGLIRYGRGDQAFLISSQVFELDDTGRSYRFRPNTRSVWLRQVTLIGGPFGLFQVLDTPRHREAAARVGAIVDDRSVQHTNSWGLRGPEPDLSAPVRGIVLGDSFMQAMFNGDDETPAIYLQRELHAALGVPVTVVNTGHIGYSPEQYYYTLLAYGDRVRPSFVVVSVCPNDFGDGWAVLRGEGDWMEEAGYWLDRITQWCRSRTVLCLLVPVPTHIQIENSRRDAFYPGSVANLFTAHASRYCEPSNEFMDEHLRLLRIARSEGRPAQRSELYNREIDDDHFSPRGAALWGRIVARRLALLLPTPEQPRDPTGAELQAGPLTDRAAGGPPP